MSQFIEAIRSENLEVARALLADHPELVHSGVDKAFSETDIDGMTPLHLAVETGSTEMVTLLIDGGANLEARNADGRTPLHDAIEYGKDHLQKLLIDRGARIDASMAAILGMHDLLRDLLEGDPSLANDRSTSMTPLCWASYGNQVESARILIDAGARMDDGELLCAASVGHVEVGRFLLDRGIDVNHFHEGFGGTALHAAAAMRYTDDSSEFVKLLLERGADPEIKAANGMTALELAKELQRRQDAAEPEHPKRFDRVVELLQSV